MELNKNNGIIESSSINEIRFNLEKERFIKQLNIFRFLALAGGGLFIVWSIPKILLAAFFRMSPTIAGVLQFVAGVVLLSVGAELLCNKIDLIENLKFNKENFLNKYVRKISFFLIFLNNLIILQIFWFIVNGIKFVGELSKL